MAATGRRWWGRARRTVHRAVFAASGGRVLGRWGGHPVVRLTTTGRRTGRRRVTMLVSPVRDGERFVLVASNGGAPRHPDWLLNLRADPDVEIATAGCRRRRMRARLADPGEEARLWPAIAAAAPAYDRYRRRTSRRIPIVLLEPPAAAAPTGPLSRGRPG